MNHRFNQLAVPLFILMLLTTATTSWGASIKLRYGFKSGATYQVNTLNHNKGKSVVEMDIMGNKQVMETPLDRTDKSRWNMKVKHVSGGIMQLSMDYGKQQGGERWGKASSGGEQVFAGSEALVDIDPVEGMVKLVTTPNDEITRVVYWGRLAWLPPLPKQTLKVGDSFSNDYKVKGEMMSMKGSDEYFLDEISKGMAYFTIESKMVTITHMPKMPAMGNIPSGMTPPQSQDWVMAHKGEGSAIFDLKEGIFVEREIKYSYGQKGQNKSMGMSMTSMHGVLKERWEMERR